MSNMTFGVNLIPNNDASHQWTLGNSEKKWTIYAQDATTELAGLMTAEDKTKLSGIASGAQVNSITGVKGSDETNYRTGNVNITPANLALGTATMGVTIKGSNVSSQQVFGINSTVENSNNTVMNGKNATFVVCNDRILLYNHTDSTTPWIMYPYNTRVKGNAESDYRSGDVNLTPANIGALATDGTAAYVTTSAASTNVIYPVGVVSGATTTLKRHENFTLRLESNAAKFNMHCSGSGAYIQHYDNNNKLCGFIYNNVNGTYEFYEYPTGVSQYREIYALPTPTTTITENKSYSILTTKNAVSIAQGGTGATTAAAARANLEITPANIGVLATSGGTLTGTLTVQDPDSNSRYVKIWGSSEGGNIQIASASDNRYEIDAYGGDSSNRTLRIFRNDSTSKAFYFDCVNGNFNISDGSINIGNSSITNDGNRSLSIGTAQSRIILFQDSTSSNPVGGLWHTNAAGTSGSAILTVNSSGEIAAIAEITTTALDGFRSNIGVNNIVTSGDSTTITGGAKFEIQSSSYLNQVGAVCLMYIRAVATATYSTSDKICTINSFKPKASVYAFKSNKTTGGATSTFYKNGTLDASGAVWQGITNNGASGDIIEMFFIYSPK